MLQLQEVWLNILVEENSCGSHGHCLRKAVTWAEEFASMFDHFNICSVAYEKKHVFKKKNTYQDYDPNSVICEQ